MLQLNGLNLKNFSKSVASKTHRWYVSLLLIMR